MNKPAIVLCCLALLSVTVTAGVFKRPRFKPFHIEGLEEKPAFWQVRPKEVIAACKNVRCGQAEVIALTPLRYPVYAVFFGDFTDTPPQTNWSAGNSSSSRHAYLGDDRKKQTILFVAGVHGSEPENVAAAINLIHLLDTGKDLLGREDKELLALTEHYRFIIVPCLNMDGRAISPDHFRGQPYELFRAASQGVWADSSLVGWLGSKEWFPLPLSKVLYPGGYPNADGYNIQHDVSPGDMRTEEARALCRLAARWRVDFMLNGHSCEGLPFVLYPSRVESGEHQEWGRQLAKKANRAILDAGLRDHEYGNERPHDTINLTNLLTWCSGGLGLTLETYHGCYNAQGDITPYTFEQMMEPAFIVLKTVMREGLTHPLAGSSFRQ